MLITNVAIYIIKILLSLFYDVHPWHWTQLHPMQKSAKFQDTNISTTHQNRHNTDWTHRNCSHLKTCPDPPVRPFDSPSP